MRFMAERDDILPDQMNTLDNVCRATDGPALPEARTFPSSLLARRWDMIRKKHTDLFSLAGHVRSG